MAAPFAEYGSKPFNEAIDYFKQKLPLPSNAHDDIRNEQHDHALIIAGANKTAIVEDFAGALQKAIKDGETLHDFQQRFDDIVARHGWSYNGTRGWRSQLIYETNIRQAYNTGREAQMEDPAFKKAFPYQEYRHSGAEHYRPQHKAWDGLVLPTEDAWWESHSPSNGYFCRCKKFPRSERALKRLGKSGPDTAPAVDYYDYVDKKTGEVLQIPQGIDPGFNHRPGASWIKHQTPQFKADWNSQAVPTIPGKRVTGPLPEPRKVSADQVLPDGLSDRQYMDVFLEQFDAQDGPKRFTDALGESLMISDELFKDRQGNLKVLKDGIRHRYMNLLAQALKDPDEIWVLLEPDGSRPGKYRLKRRYLVRWETEEDGQPIHGFSAFEYGQGLWTGGTVFTPFKRKGKHKMPARNSYMETQRKGVRVFRKGNSE